MPERDRRWRAALLRAFAQFGFVKRDADSHDFIVAAARMPRPGAPRHGFDDQLDGLQPAPGLRVQREPVSMEGKRLARPAG